MTSNFTYTTGIPNGPNDPSADQPIMQTNTNSINSLIGTDHIGFNTNFGGAHNQIQMPNVSTAVPAGLFGNGFETFYSKLGGTMAAGELWFVRGSAASGIQLTGPGNPSNIGNNGYTFLSGALAINFGSITGLSGAWPTSPQTLTYTSANQSFQNNTLIVLTSFIGPTSSSTGEVVINSTTKNGFTWQFTGSSSASFGGFYWMAIGI